MMKWDKALREGKVFSKESIALAYTPSSNLVPDQSNYGLGWRILLVPNGKKIIYHNGWWHGNRSVFIRLLDEEAVIVILSNSSFTTISNSRKLADLFGAYKQTGKSIVNF
jgi:CubicO group peptidase (beta-lactamase class C family)